MFERGAIVGIDHRIGVVVLTGKELGGDLMDHTGVWSGTIVVGIPEVWTIPNAYLSRGPQPTLKH
jgi:hypothetical protein